MRFSDLTYDMLSDGRYMVENGDIFEDFDWSELVDELNYTTKRQIKGKDHVLIVV